MKLYSQINYSGELEYKHIVESEGKEVSHTSLHGSGEIHSSQDRQNDVSKEPSASYDDGGFASFSADWFG